MSGSELDDRGEQDAWSVVATWLTGVRGDLPLALLDALLVVAAYALALFLRFDGDVPSTFSGMFGLFVTLAVVAHVGSNWMWGLYGRMWRHASVQEARSVLLAGATATVALAILSLPGERLVPVSVLALGAIVVTAAMGAVRFHARLFAFRRATHTVRRQRVAIFGAGEAGASLVQDMLRSSHEFLPVAILDDDRHKHGRSLAGVPIVGGREDVGEVVDRYGVEHLLLAIPSASKELVGEIAHRAEQAGIPLKILPSVSELVTGEVRLRDVRAVEIGDLVGRSQVTTDLEAVTQILRGRRVLITGAGGSIGSEIARQVAEGDPAAVILLDHDETHLYETALGLDDLCLQVLADVREARVIDRIFEQHRPQVVFHAAAHKHVPILERHPSEAVATNVIGTNNVVDAADRHGAEHLVFISTDKAVRPVSVMGASKRVAEQLVLARSGPGRRYCAVRFGNVLGSRGSVVPRFMEQIERGGPVTVTDPRMTRYFMSVSEAVQLVLQAAVFAESGEILMLDMGEPVRIMDLAERMIRLSGRRVGADIALRITGPRPGEKLFEELHEPEESVFETPHPSIFGLYPALAEWRVQERRLRHLSTLLARGDEDRIRTALMEMAADPAGHVIVLDPGPQTLIGEPHGTG